MKFPKGSEWRKWDLHVHTPLTFHNNQFHCSMEDFITELLKTDIAVYGITNYFCFAPNEIESVRAGLSGSGKIIIPNLEFRIEQPNKDDEQINLHVLFREDIEIEEVNQTLGRIELINTIGGKTAYCSKSDIDTIGADNIIISWRSLLTQLEKDFTPVQDYIVIGCPRGYGSFRPAPNVGRGHALAREIDNICHGFFGKKADRDYFLNSDRFPNAISKPVLQASDAHKLHELGSEFTWIKADPSFEGLKQTLFEPECRVSLETQSPYELLQKIKINKISLLNGNGFPIDNQVIEFNRDLVCIIGGRGSGKSAILETLAYCFDKHFSLKLDGKKRYSGHHNYNQGFIDFNINSKKDIEIEIEYSDKDDKVLPVYRTNLLAKSEDCGFPFLYLGQNQIESFAIEFEEVHSLVFDTVKGNSSIVADLDKIESEIEEVKLEISNLNLEINQDRSKLDGLQQASLKSQLNNISKELELLTSESNRRVLENLSAKRELKDKYDNIDALVQKIEGTIGKAQNDLVTTIEKVNQSLPDIGLNNSLTLEFNLLSAPIDKLKIELKKLTIEAEYESALDEAKKQLQGKIDVSVEYIEGLKTQKQNFDQKIKEADVIKNSILINKEKRKEALKKVYSKYLEYKELYNTAISEFTEANKEVLDSVKIKAALYFGIDSLIEELYNDHIDKRKIKSFDKFKQEYFNDLNSDGSDFAEWLENYLSSIENLDVYYNNDISKIEGLFYDNHLSLLSELEYQVSDAQFKPLQQLSLGQKGTVLLKIFLSTGKNSPIIIDQPEDHLDNDFIYTDLVRTIRRAKDKRQVIVVTHDANLVVNGDAEQVIVAVFEDGLIKHNKRGSLENKTIRSKVAKILEGGDIAFKKREQKYQFEMELA